MKIAIIVFSPSGNTLKVAKMLESHLLENNILVQIVDITRTKEVFRYRTFGQYLKQHIEEHDVLCIGSPVYAHHLHYNVQDLIKSLPPPGDGWGRLAIPFITYGGINSGVALQEAGHLLKKTGRIPIAGMKINSQHSLTKLPQISVKVNEGMPGKEIDPLIEELSHKLLNGEGFTDASKEFCYQKLKVRIKAKTIFREKLWQNYLYPKQVINLEKCIHCSKCSNICPVQRIEMIDKRPTIPKGSPSCIHCGSCVSHCPSHAITFNTNWNRWNKLLSKAAAGHGPLPSNEVPKSAVYGIVLS
ncbi:MAG: EFR1 family ferrodoxin [Promethearchaeota archaeon]